MDDRKVKTDMGCINCGFTTSDEMEFRFHPCGKEITHTQYSIARAKAKERKAEIRRDEAEDKIQEIIGEKWETFMELRNLFIEWEDSDAELGEASEKIIRLENG